MDSYIALRNCVCNRYGKVSRKSLFSTSTVLSLICIGVIIYSVIGVGGWDGMGLGLFTITILVGIWIGTVIGAISRSSNL